MVDEDTKGQFPRNDIRAVLRDFGVTQESRATTTDSTEEVILLPMQQMATLGVRALTAALTRLLPHTKVWVAHEHPRWTGEPL